MLRAFSLFPGRGETLAPRCLSFGSNDSGTLKRAWSVLCLRGGSEKRKSLTLDCFQFLETEKLPVPSGDSLDHAVCLRVTGVATKRSMEEEKLNALCLGRGAGRATRGIQVTRSKARLRLEMRNRGTRKPKAVRRGSLANRALSRCTTLQHTTLRYNTLC